MTLIAIGTPAAEREAFLRRHIAEGLALVADLPPQPVTPDQRRKAANNTRHLSNYVTAARVGFSELVPGTEDFNEVVSLIWALWYRPLSHMFGDFAEAAKHEPGLSDGLPPGLREAAVTLVMRTLVFGMCEAEFQPRTGGTDCW